MGSREGAYPAHWEADVVLRDGGTAHLRPISPDDSGGVQEFHSHQSPQSVYFRFFAAMPRLSSRDLQRFTRVDHVDRVALVATVSGRIVGIARYDRLGSGAAEVAFNIADGHQGRGLASALLEHLAAAARERGVHRFVAEVLPDNRRMIGVFRDAGYEVRHDYDDGVIAVSFAIDPTERSMAVMAAREHRAEARSIQALLHPRSVVVIGASRQRASIGHRLLENLVSSGFLGAVHAVNPEAFEVQGVISYARVTEVPGPVDLAVVAVPAAVVEEVVADCAQAGVRALVVVSGGFAETGDQGLARQRALVRRAHAEGMRVVGPNSFGILNTDPAVRLNASLAPELPPRGRLGLFSQSGALGIAVLSSAARRGLGVSSFVSAGNRADVSGNDCMQYWQEDEGTDAVGLYLESMGNPRKFSRVARRLARVKPVMVVKSGLSGYGVPPGHAVRHSRAPREALDSMLRQAGVIRVENVHQLFDVAQLALHQPLPRGPRVGVVANSGSLAALAADACDSWGLAVTHGPVSVSTEADAGEFEVALRAVFDADAVDSVVAAFIPPLATQDAEVVSALARTAGASGKTAVACLLGMRGIDEALSGQGQGGGTRTVPAYSTPEDAVRALVAVTRYAAWRERDAGQRVDPAGCDPQAAARLVEDLLTSVRGGIDLKADQCARLLGHYGIDVWPAIGVSNGDEAVAAAERVGWPVVLKSTTQPLRHRVDLGGVRMDIAGEAELRAHLEEMRDQLSPRHEMSPLPPGGGYQFVVQRMAPAGVACVLQTMEDPLFGPVVSFGLGGDATELLGDVAHRIPPLTDVDVADLIRSVRAAPRLFGHRGAQATDVPALEDLVARVSRLADDLPEVAELVINPVLSLESGTAVLAASIRLKRAPGRADAERRTLPEVSG